jgi:hypothetical protein
LSLGQMLSVWLTFILSEGDHRLSHVEPWIAAHQQTPQSLCDPTSLASRWR